MKVKDTKEQTTEFKPFSIEVTFESPEEARLFYHCCNRMDLDKAINNRTYGEWFNYLPVARHLDVDTDEVRTVLANNGVQIEEQT